MFGIKEIEDTNSDLIGEFHIKVIQKIYFWLHSEVTHGYLYAQ